jgi:hypothetical protein
LKTATSGFTLLISYTWISLWHSWRLDLLQATTPHWK